MSVLQKLTEGIVERSLQKEGAALLDKWEATGLLEGLDNDADRAGMARLLENQASQLLKEASSMGAGDVEGFASVAFPIVRRVFAGLLANDLVSVQPMSLPSGLIFFMDFTYSDQTDLRLGLGTQSLYGGGVIGSQLTGGVSDITEAGGGFYNLANAYSSPTGSHNDAVAANAAFGAATTIGSLSEPQKKILRYDPDLLGLPDAAQVAVVDFEMDADMQAQLNKDLVTAATINDADFRDTGALTAAGGGDQQIRRLTKLNAAGTSLELVIVNPTGSLLTSATADVVVEFPLADQFTQGDALGSVRGSNFPLEGAGDGSVSNFNNKAEIDEIPEIDIKVDSIAVTAQTKKLKAKWTPELGQDLNAYHNLDAEVELTQILSEQIALEIDREIVNDLVQGATAGTFYWSRSPGLFVDRVSGEELGATAASPDFTGTVSEWYETLIETINDVSAQIHRKTLRGGANYLVTSPEVANILEFTAGFRANVTHDADKGSVGAVNVGSISRKFDVHVDPYFPRNLILVGRKGGSFLESGYVYAPYVPLQVTPTIFGVEDFVPRKGVMTRYAKKMVRPDMYGLVVCRGLLGESGS